MSKPCQHQGSAGSREGECVDKSAQLTRYRRGERLRVRDPSNAILRDGTTSSDRGNTTRLADARPGKTVLVDGSATKRRSTLHRQGRQ